MDNNENQNPWSQPNSPEQEAKQQEAKQQEEIKVPDYSFMNDPLYKKRKRKTTLIIIGVIILVVIGIPLFLFGACIFMLKGF